MKRNTYLFTFFFSLTLSFCLISCSKQCSETPCNEGVPMSYIPVCGCNDITYPNWESAECHGITHYRTGECENWVGDLLSLSTASSPLIVDSKKCLNSAQQWEQQMLVTVCNAWFYWGVCSSAGATNWLIQLRRSCSRWRSQTQAKLALGCGRRSQLKLAKRAESVPCEC